ncbi:MAG: LysR family transcriptional regulator [Xanthobacteraceae bacterium]
MQQSSLGLLTSLDALLAEGSVTGAAARMNRSVSAMSRTLARIRRSVGDPILVRGGGRLVLTPRAEALRSRVRQLVEEAGAVLRPSRVSLGSLERTFTIRANDAFISAFASQLAALLHGEAPGVALCFAPEGDEDVDALREGRIDLDIGIIGKSGPEVKIQTLFRDRFIGAVRAGHSLTRGKINPKRFVAYPHVVASRRGRAQGPIDDALVPLGLTRTIALVVPSHTAALLVAAGSDLIASVPSSLVRRGVIVELAMKTFELPFGTGAIAIGQAWHPRLDADAAHQWLRTKVREVCRSHL